MTTQEEEPTEGTPAQPEEESTPVILPKDAAVSFLTSTQAPRSSDGIGFPTTIQAPRSSGEIVSFEQPAPAPDAPSEAAEQPAEPAMADEPAPAEEAASEEPTA